MPGHGPDARGWAGPLAIVLTLVLAPFLVYPFQPFTGRFELVVAAVAVVVGFVALAAQAWKGTASE